MKKELIVLVLLFLLIGGGAMLYKGNKQKAENPQQENKVSVAIRPEVTQETEKVANEIELSIIQPQNNTAVVNPMVSVVGKTAPNADVFVNDKELKADSQGNFSTTVELDEGENTISVLANNSDGAFTEKEIIVTLESTE